MGAYTRSPVALSTWISGRKTLPAISYTISIFAAAAIAISLLLLRAYTIDERALVRKIEAHSLAENEI